MAKAPPDFKPLIAYFLNLFKVQVAGENEPAETEAVAISETPGKDIIYELTIRHHGTSKTRRMSLRSLGEQVESKSMCYKVIYDDFLVVKIPPRPIIDFNDYLNHIQQEHTIAARLTPSIPCVCPQLGAILKKVPSLRLPPELPPERIETEYVDRLTRKPELQRYLKIGEGFVFFMGLSQYLFFNQVIDSIHHSSDLIRQEITRNGPSAIADMHAFETLYGADHEDIYFEMHALMKNYEKTIETTILDSEVSVWIADYQVQEWFFSRVAGTEPEFDHADLPPELSEKIDSITIGMLSDKKTVITGFQNLVLATVNRKRFDSSRARIKGLIINVIELLHRLKNRSVAIRDLKPDNMYVAAFLDGADHLLANHEAYDLGLIDLETAVCYEKEEGRIPQPLLAGTPSYATPTHIFNNALLSAVYGDELPRIFYMQDWYAGLVMIFNVVTGRPLFIRTAKLMPEISRMKKKDIRDARTQLSVFETGSRLFWKTAKEELQHNLNKYHDWLRDVEILFPEHLAESLAAECRLEKALIHDWVAARIDRCRPAEKYREKLLAASHDKICRILSQDVHDNDAVKGWDEFLRLLSVIEPLIRRKEELDLAETLFSASTSCHDLISFLFDRIYHAMYRPDWAGR